MLYDDLNKFNINKLSIVPMVLAMPKRFFLFKYHSPLCFLKKFEEPKTIVAFPKLASPFDNFLLFLYLMKLVVLLRYSAVDGGFSLLDISPLVLRIPVMLLSS